MSIFEVWDAWHPSEVDDEEGPYLPESGDYEECDELPSIPTIDGIPSAVDYDDRGANDYVISGPLPLSEGPGRRFDSKKEAYAWAREKFGSARVTEIDSGEVRWACRIKKS